MSCKARPLAATILLSFYYNESSYLSKNRNLQNCYAISKETYFRTVKLVKVNPANEKSKVKSRLDFYFATYNSLSKAME